MKRTILLLYVTCMTVCAHANDSDLIQLTLLEEGQEDYVFLFVITQKIHYIFLMAILKSVMMAIFIHLCMFIGMIGN